MSTVFDSPDDLAKLTSKVLTAVVAVVRITAMGVPLAQMAEWDWRARDVQRVNAGCFANTERVADLKGAVRAAVVRERHAKFSGIQGTKY